MRRVAKGLYRHVLASQSPFIVGAESQPVRTPFLTEHANASNQRTMPADKPMATVCAQVKGGHFSVIAPTLAPLRGTSEQHLVGHSVESSLSTVSAGGQHHALAMAHITKFNTGSVGSAMDAPLPTVTAGGTPKRPSTGIQMGVVAANLVTIGYGERAGQQPRVHSMKQPLGTVVSGGIKSALVAAHLVDMGHGEGPAGGKRFSHGVRSLEVPLNTVTASGATSALVAACLEQANGGFYEGDGRPADAPMSTVTASGTQQRLITAYLVKYYSEGGQDSACNAPMHTVPTKARMGLVQTVKVPADALAPEHAQRARLCAELLHQHLPEQFPDPATLVLMRHAGQLWALVDITLRMLKPRELYRAQGFPEHYQIEEIPDPALLFIDGKQAPGNPLDLPRIALSTTAQVRMVGNSVPPPVAAALVRANFRHEALLYAA
jgi:DNA (cytosine-5)-methyltransferase 1